MAESILDTLMTTLTDIEITDNGQALDLFNKNRERDIVNFVSTILKEDVPMPEIVFDQASIDTLNDYLGSNAVALYDSEAKKIIFDESTSINDERFKNFVAHEVMHYVDDIAAPDVEEQALFRTDQPNLALNPEVRGDIIRYGAGWDFESKSTVPTPDWAYQFAQNVSDPQEHLSYYTEQERGIVPEFISEDAALRALDEWRPLVEHVTESPGKWPWSEPRTSRSWTGGIEPGYNISDISAYTQDRGAILDIFDELAGKYLSEKGKSEYYQK